MQFYIPKMQIYPGYCRSLKSSYLLMLNASPGAVFIYFIYLFILHHLENRTRPVSTPCDGSCDGRH